MIKINLRNIEKVFSVIIFKNGRERG